MKTLLIIAALWTILTFYHACHSLDTQCGTHDVVDELMLESHPCVWTARIEYDCTANLWWGWVTGEDGLLYQTENYFEAGVYNELRAAADEVHGYNRISAK